MNYIYYVKQQLQLYGLYIITSAITYGFFRNFEWKEPIILTQSWLAAFVSGSLTFIFFGAYMNMRSNFSKK